MNPPPRISSVPLLRILLPFIVGILAHQVCHGLIYPAVAFAVAILTYISLRFVAAKNPSARYRISPFHILPFSVAFIALGFIAAEVSAPTELNTRQINGNYVIARITDISFSDFSMSMKVDVCGYYSATRHLVETPKAKALVSTKGCNYQLQPGDIITFQGNLSEIKNNGNPDEFDYAKFMRWQGYVYCQHLDQHQVLKCGHKDDILSLLANTRNAIQSQILAENLPTVTHGMLIAVLLGNNDFIDAQTRQDFANAGVAHLLALSGLHIGILTFIFWWLLFPLDFCGLKKLRLCLTLLALCAYALFTGLSTSVIRSTIMFAFVFVALISDRKPNALNSLAFAALLILTFSPSSLYSAGFQLSFITVLSLVLFSVVCTTHFKVQFLNQVASLLLTSLVAMVSTLALTGYYFHSVSMIGVLTNMLILPIFPVFIFAGVAFIFLLAVGVHLQFAVWLIAMLGKYISFVVDTANALPVSHISGIYVHGISVFLYFMALLLLFLWIYHKNARFLICASACAAAIITYGCVSRLALPPKGIVVFNDYSSTPILCFNKATAVVWTPESDDFDLDEFQRTHIGFLSHYGISSLSAVHSYTNQHADIYTTDNYAMIFGKKFIVAGKGHWKKATDSHATTDYVIVCKTFHGKIADLRRLISYKTLVLSGAIYNDNLTALTQEFNIHSWQFHSLAASGAITMFFGS